MKASESTLALQFLLDGNAYAIPAGCVHRVVPFVATRPINGTPPGVLGIFHLRGRPVPAVDLSVLMGLPPTRRRFSSRFIVVEYPSADAVDALLAILAEGVTDIVDLPADAWRDAGIAVPGRPFLGPVATVGDRVVQRVEIADLLPAEVRQLLFRRIAEDERADV